MQKNTHRAWAEINLYTIENNFKNIQKRVGDCGVLCVIKANAYGHGSIPVAQRLQEAGAAYLGVATVPEAIELREHGITLPILILGYVDDADAPMVAHFDITAAVYDYETAEVLSQAALREGRKINVHFKLDTGMSRLGFPAQEQENTVREILRAAQLPGLYPTGIFTHFAVSDETSGQDFTQLQQSRFEAVCDALEARGLHLPVKHSANSGAVLQHPGSYMNMVRAGIILYGYYPDRSIPRTLNLRPAMTVKAHVAQVHQLQAGCPVSYGRTYVAPHDTRLAVLSIGYADGYLRGKPGHAHVVIGGRIVPVVGRICMDMCMAELPDDLNVRRGDEAIIFGPDGVTAEDLADSVDTITYEVLCAVSSRVPRIYID
ncbi:MAG: alanine racemase [Intestinibacillus sp.]